MAKKTKHVKRAPRSTPRAAVATGSALDEHMALASPMIRWWADSRSGAIAGRGYHYQDLVGAWVALRLLTGDIDAARLIAEGLDDLTCENSVPHQVQVKSRQERVGDFRTSEAARFVVEAWQRRLVRTPADTDELAVVVVERAVGGYAPRDWAVRLTDDPAWADLVSATRQLAQNRGIPSDAVDLLLARTTAVVLPQQYILDDAAHLVAARTGLPLGATIPVVQALRAAVAEHADRNAEVAWDERVGLSRTDIERTVTDAVALVDRKSLEQAVANGSCEPVDFDTPLPDPEFYSGTATQPGHIAAGLLTARPGPTDEALAGLGSGKAVLVTGPSGIGKSAVLWMATYVARHVVWYRVHRLQEDDVEPLIRLGVASGAGRHGPVGFVVDGVGTGPLAAWDELQRRAAALPGVLLLGSVREEDTLPLETFGQCVVVRPRLDDELAARIHSGLLDSGATTQPHWREAFDQSDGLTLEFTHLLTRGRRLRDVIGDQVRDRVREGRSVELAVIAPVSAAHRWGATLPVTQLADIVAAPPAELKTALTRLVDEHVLTIDNGVVSGLHPVRSAALCDAVHQVPPPSVADTVRDVIQRIDASHLIPFVARAVADDATLGAAIVDSLASRLAGSAAVDLPATAAALAGLRLADFTAMAKRWATILDRHDVPVPHRPLGLDLAMLDSDLGDGFDPRLVGAVDEIRRDRESATFPLRDQLIDRIGVAALNDMIHNATDVADVTSLLSPLAETGLVLTTPPAGAPLCSTLETAPLADFGELVATARSVSLATGLALLDAAGGRLAILDRLGQERPWLLDLDIVVDAGETVLRGRILHVADQHNPDGEKDIKAFAVLGLKCLPNVDRADLTTVLAGGVPLSINEYEFGVSGLLRQYVHSDSAIAWNRERSRFARSLVAARSTTERLAAGLAVLDGTADFLADLADAWVTNRMTGQRVTTLHRQRDKLLGDIDALAPERAAQPLGGPVDQRGGMLDNDPVHGVAQGIVRNLASRLDDPSGYAAVAAFAGDTIAKQLDDARREPWALLGFDRPPPVIDRLADLLDQFATVLIERAIGDTPPAQVTSVTRSMRRGKALPRAVGLVTARARRRYEETVAALVAEATIKGLRLEARSQPHPDPQVVTWPPMSTAVIAHLNSWEDLEPTIATVSDLLTRFQLPDSSLLVIPAKDEVPLLRYAVRLFASGGVYPLADTQPWLDVIPPTKSMSCADAVADAVDALRELSSIAWLDTQRGLSGAITTIQAAADDAVSRFGDAATRLGALPHDLVTEGLAEEIDLLADRVQQEIDDRATEGVFAEGVARGLTGEQTEDFLNISELVIIATEWDLDPASAQELVAATTGDRHEPEL